MRYYELMDFIHHLGDKLYRDKYDPLTTIYVNPRLFHEVSKDAYENRALSIGPSFGGFSILDFNFSWGVVKVKPWKLPEGIEDCCLWESANSVGACAMKPKLIRENYDFARIYEDALPTNTIDYKVDYDIDVSEKKGLDFVEQLKQV